MQAIKLHPKKTSNDIVNQVKADLDRYFEQFEKLRKEEEEAYFGVIWKNTNQYRPYENTIFEIIETEVPILSDGFPAPTVKTLDQKRLAVAKNLEKAIHWVNKDQDLELKYPEVIRSSLVTGTGYIHPWYDFHDKNGEGREKYEILHWKKVKLAGNSKNIEDCSKARIELDRQKEWLKLEYPDHAKKIDKLKGKKGLSGDREGLESRDSGAGYARRAIYEDYHDEETLCLVKTFKKDYSLVKIPEKETLEEIENEGSQLGDGIAPDLEKWQDHRAHNEAHAQKLASLYTELGVLPGAGNEAAMEAAEILSQENPEAADYFGDIVLQIEVMTNHIQEHEEYLKLNPNGMKLKYPGGYRQIDSVEDVILYDGKNKSFHQEIPIVPFYCYRNGTIYGDSEVRNLLDCQRMQAVMLRKEYKGLQLVADPAKEVNQDSGLTKDDITNEPGAVYEVKSGTSWTTRNVAPGQTNPQLNQFANDRVEKMERISGMSDPTRGEMPSNRPSEVSVMITQNQALGRIRLKDRQNKYYSLQRLGKLVASDIIQYWTTEKILEIEDQNGRHEEVIFHPLEVDGLEYDIEVDADTMSSIDREKYNMFATSLMNAGKISFSQWSELVDLPKIEKIKKFAQENDEQAAQMEQMAAQMQELQIANIKLKVAASGPEALTPEEFKIYEEMERQEILAETAGLNAEQPEGAI